MVNRTLKAFELRGKRFVGEANVVCIFCAAYMLSSLDLTSPEAMPIVKQLENVSTATILAPLPVYLLSKVPPTDPVSTLLLVGR
jgi:hypothetical protein